MKAFCVKILTPEISAALQTLAIERGIIWADNTSEVDMTYAPYLFFDKTMTRGYGSQSFEVVSIEEAVNRLSKYEPPIKIGEYIVTFDDASKQLKVGCQTISYEVVKQVYDRTIKNG